MLHQAENGKSSRITPFINNILDDTRSLFSLEMALVKSEARQSWAQAKSEALAIGIGVGLAVVGAFVLALGLVHLLQWAFLSLPLWSCYVMAGLFVELVAVVLMSFMRQKSKLTRLDKGAL